MQYQIISLASRLGNIFDFGQITRHDLIMHTDATYEVRYQVHCNSLNDVKGTISKFEVTWSYAPTGGRYPVVFFFAKSDTVTLRHVYQNI